MMNNTDSGDTKDARILHRTSSLVSDFIASSVC